MIGPARNAAVQIINALPIRAIPEAFQIGDGDFRPRCAVEQEPGIAVHMGSGVQHDVVFPRYDLFKTRFRFLQ